MLKASLLCENCVCKLATENNNTLMNIINTVCNRPHIDCYPIKPGGDHFLPNSTYCHATWVINEWYRLHNWYESCDSNFDKYTVPGILAPPVCKDGPSSIKGRNK